MKNKYFFIITVSFICSMLLSLASEGLKDKKNLNIELDKKKNILQSIGIETVGLSSEMIISKFNFNIKEQVINIDGMIVNDILHKDLEKNINRRSGDTEYYNENIKYFPLFISETMNSIILPISGKGLWSSLFGYVAINSKNYSTVNGITFYAHGETPGLGAEISKDWFKSNFVGKEIYDGGTLVSVRVAKAGMANKSSSYEVDGISGATITSNGVEELLKRDLKKYEPYFNRNK
jgi:Na+-transporting NADH:ubiquinone oxidoreductase subunit C